MKIHRRAFFNRLGLGAAGIYLAPSFRMFASASSGSLPRGVPEAQGVSSAGILDFLDAVNHSKHEFHSFMMARHGQVIAEGWWAPYRADLNHMLYSLSKSFTSTAIGLAVTSGKLTVDDAVTCFFPDKLPATVSENLAALKVKHLLTMSVGHAKDSTPIITKEHDWVKTFLSLPIEHEPGSVFLYNSGATYMLSAIVQKVTGEKAIDYLRPRLFEPLAVEGMTWEKCPLGINTGGWGLAIQTETVAKFAQLYLQNGSWNGRQLIPASWVHEATTFKIQQPATDGADLEQLKKTSEWHQGYCYQFWRTSHNAFRGDGAFGQYAFVLPEQDTIIAITSETGEMAGEFKLIWDHLLPAIKPSPLPADDSAHAQLKQTLASLVLPLAPGNASSAPLTKSFKLEPNDSKFDTISLQCDAQSCIINFDSQAVHCGVGKWIEGVTSLPGTPPKLTVGDLRPAKIAASAAWKDANTLVMLWRYIETPHHDTVTCQLDGDKLTLTWLNSLTEKSSNRPETRPALHGTPTA